MDKKPVREIREEMSEDLLLRYSRQVMLPDFDIEGQERLRNSRALIIGLGGLGCPVAMYIGAAGLGELWLADFDRVDLSNLQRQIAHQSRDLGQNKARSVAESISGMNPDCQVKVFSSRLEGELLAELAGQVDVVVDCTDNYQTRSDINKACVSTGTPLVSGAAIRWEGQLAVFANKEDSPCYHCLYGQIGNEQLTCSEAGIMSPVVGIVGSMQALEAIKLLSGKGEVSSGQVLLFDGKTSTWRSFKLSRDPACEVCGTNNA